MEEIKDISALKELIKSTPKPKFGQEPKKKTAYKDMPPFTSFKEEHAFWGDMLRDDQQNGLLKPNFQNMWFSGEPAPSANPIFTFRQNASSTLDLSGCALRNVDFGGCVLSALDLSRADMSGCVIDRETTPIGTKMQGANLCSASVIGVDFNDTDMTDASLYKAAITSARFPEDFEGKMKADTEVEPPSVDAHVLDLSSNDKNISHVPTAYEHHNIATTLNLSANAIMRVSSEFGRFPMLNTLNLSNNLLTEIPECVFHLPQLRMLDVSSNKIKEISPEIGRLGATLEHLNISGNVLDALPDSMGALRNLSFLNAGSNRLKGIPAQMCSGLQKLQRLYIDNNKIEALPENFGELKSLSTLAANKNVLKSLPRSFGMLTNLVSCCLSDNIIGDIPPEACENLKSLSILILSNNSLTTLPPTITNSRVTSLILDHNKFAVVPNPIVGMVSIKILILSFNNITTIPQPLYELDTSRKIYIYNNPCSRGYFERRIPNVFC